MATLLPDSPARQVLHTALDRLVARGALTRSQADAVLTEVGAGVSTRSPAGTERRGWTTVLAEVGGYIGAAFVAAAVLVFTGPKWGQLGTGERLATLGIPAVLLLVGAAGLAQTAPGRWSPRPRPGLGARRRLVSALVLVGGGLTGGLVAVLVRNDGTGDALAHEATLVGLALLAVWTVGYACCRVVLLHLAMAAAACLATGAATAWWLTDSDGVAVGAGLVVVATVWLGLAMAGVLEEREIGYGVAGVIAFIGGEVIATAANRSWGGYLVVAVVAAAGLAGYIRTRMLTVLVVGVVALGTVVPQAIIDFTDGALGAAGALLVTGLSIVGASVLGLGIHREVPGRHDADGSQGSGGSQLSGPAELV